MLFGVDVSCRILYSIVIYMQTVADQIPRLGKREPICLLWITCNYVVSVRRGFLFLWVLGMGCVIQLWHSLSLPYKLPALDQIKASLKHSDGSRKKTYTRPLTVTTEMKPFVK